MEFTFSWLRYKTVYVLLSIGHTLNILTLHQRFCTEPFHVDIFSRVHAELIHFLFLIVFHILSNRSICDSLPQKLRFISPLYRITLFSQCRNQFSFFVFLYFKLLCGALMLCIYITNFYLKSHILLEIISYQYIHTYDFS